MPPRYAEFFGPERETVHRIVHQLEWRCSQRRNLSNSEVYRMLRELPIEALLYGMARTEHEEARRLMSHFVTHLRSVVSLIGGRDLQSMGLKPGPRYGEILNKLVAARLDGLVSTREDELRLVRRLLAG
jgi:tRNA nucleotidyltransferase (CCA-adding enzyme)